MAKAKRKKVDSPRAPLTDDERSAFRRQFGIWREAFSLLADKVNKIRWLQAEGARARDMLGPPRSPQEEQYLRIFDTTTLHEDWNELARAIGRGSPRPVVERLSGPGRSGSRADVANGFAVALQDLVNQGTEDYDSLHPVVRNYLRDLVGLFVMRVDIHANPSTWDREDAERRVRSEILVAFHGPPDGTADVAIVAADGVKNAAVGCAARLFQVEPRTIWNAPSEHKEAGGLDVDGFREALRFRQDVHDKTSVATTD
jgi:hypothetical protein